jgi:hypothetical protein
MYMKATVTREGKFEFILQGEIDDVGGFREDLEYELRGSFHADPTCSVFDIKFETDGGTTHSQAVMIDEGGFKFVEL